jgi:GNAT superfamily N-acetyltransferase
MTDRDDACSSWDNSGCEGTPYCPPRCPRFVDGEEVPLVVAPYEDDDFEALVEMYDTLDSDNRTVGVPPIGRANVEDWLAALTADGWNLVARDGDRVAGHVGVAPADAADPEFVIFVHDDYQGRGLGTELVRHAVAYADDRGHDRLGLDVARENQGAITVYENVDFEVTETGALELTMALSMDDPITDEVTRPPAER